MIILDPADDISKHVIPVGAPGPSTESSEDVVPPPPPYTPRSTDPLLLGSSRLKEPSARRRFWRALAFAFVVWLAAVALLGSWLDLLYHRRRGVLPRYPEVGCISALDWTYNWNGHPDNKSDTRQWAKLELELPADTPAFSFNMSGSLASGFMAISADPEWDTPNVSYQIVAAHPSRQVFSGVKLCRTVEDGHQIMSIQVPSAPGYYDDEPVQFIAALTFPTVSAARSVHPDVMTNLPSFKQTVRAVSGKVRFGELSLSGKDCLIDIDRVVAEKVVIKNQNAAITGAFEVTQSLDLRAENGKIDVVADLTSVNGTTTSTNMTMWASQHPIEATLSLQSSSWHGTGGRFDIVADGAGAPISLKVVSAPLDSCLTLDARGSGAPARAELHPTFEGMYQVEASHPGHAEFVNADTIDPSGQGKKKIRTGLNWRDQRINGFIGWGGIEPTRKESYGAVKIISSEHASLLW